MVEEDGEETQEEQKMEKKKGKSSFICQGVFSYAKKKGWREGKGKGKLDPICLSGSLIACEKIDAGSHAPIHSSVCLPFRIHH